MNNAENDNSENNSEHTPSDGSRPFGFWITAVDRLSAAAFATAFEDEGITRRDWRILNLIDGTVPADRELHGPKLRRLAALGWIRRTDEGWTLTGEGTAAKARLSTAVDEIRAQVAAPLSPEDFAAMAASLEKVARGLGWAEGMRLPRPARTRDGRRGQHGHAEHHGRPGHGFAHGEHGFGPREHGFGPRDGERHGHGFGPDHDEHHGHGERHDHREHCDGRAAFGHVHRRHGHGPFPRGAYGAPAHHVHIHLHD
ncbi:hypothetical protein [Microbacterium panaciterrae]|uniref:MarR family transcriptional regulator n=1 Tax=Microbacterium panaciterrae TaxID=985759 RepID=A0ABP8P462_9MICO